MSGYDGGVQAVSDEGAHPGLAVSTGSDDEVLAGIPSEGSSGNTKKEQSCNTSSIRCV